MEIILELYTMIGWYIMIWKYVSVDLSLQNIDEMNDDVEWMCGSWTKYCGDEQVCVLCYILLHKKTGFHFDSKMYNFPLIFDGIL